jgi:2-(3-amino-3-carboxypropyl)histidine synthase
MLPYDLEREKVKKFLKQVRAERVGVQLPPGLGGCWPEIRAALEDCGVEGILVGSSCYGACDLADEEALKAGCGALLHYGHSDMGLPSRLPVLYVEAGMRVDPSPAVEDALPDLKYRRLGLTTTVQHLSYLENLRKLLLSKGFEVHIGEPSGRARYPGQVLGCDVGSATSVAEKVEAFLHVGTGSFHPLGVAAATGKEVVSVSPLGGRGVLSAGEFLRWRRGVVARALSCRSFGILLSTKRGQWRPDVAGRVEEDLRKDGRKTVQLVQEEVKVGELENFGLEAYVCTACPRIALEDAKETEIPILTPFEVEVMLGRRGLEPYQLW